MSITTIFPAPVLKDPDADLDWTIDWSGWLATGETIEESVWSAPDDSGIEVHDSVLDEAKTKATAWLNGGAEGRHLVTNSIVTSAGRKDNRSLLVTVRER